MNAVHRGFVPPPGQPSGFEPLGGPVAKIGRDAEASRLAEQTAVIRAEAADRKRRRAEVARRAEATRAPEPPPLADPEPKVTPAPSAKPGEPLVGADGSVTLAGDDYKLLQRAADIAVRNQERQSFRSRS